MQNRNEAEECTKKVDRGEKREMCIRTEVEDESGVDWKGDLRIQPEMTLKDFNLVNSCINSGFAEVKKRNCGEGIRERRITKRRDAVEESVRRQCEEEERICCEMIRIRIELGVRMEEGGESEKEMCALLNDDGMTKCTAEEGWIGERGRE